MGRGAKTRGLTLHIYHVTLPNMGISKDQQIEQKQTAQWHYQNCEIEYDNGEIPAAWCEHLVDVTECLPDPIEPDVYENSQENLNGY